MQKKWIAGGLLVLGLLGVCGCSSQAFVSEQQAETVLTKEETGWEFQDGTYQMEVELLGGSGRASVTSPAKVEIKDGKAVATLEWSSPNYDYMVVDGEKYLPVNTEGNSVFQIPVEAFDQDIAVIADTVAMSTPHEIEYTLNFHAGENGQNAAKADTTETGRCRWCRKRAADSCSRRKPCEDSSRPSDLRSQHGAFLRGKFCSGLLRGRL